jgi:hypothetical protein
LLFQLLDDSPGAAVGVEDRSYLTKAVVESELVNSTNQLSFLLVNRLDASSLPVNQLRASVIAEHFTPTRHHPGLARFLLKAADDATQVLALLDLGSEKLDIGRQIIGVQPQIVDLLFVNDQTAGAAADLLDELTVDEISVPGQTCMVLTDQGPDLSPPNPMQERLKNRPIVQLLPRNTSL